MSDRMDPFIGGKDPSSMHHQVWDGLIVLLTLKEKSKPIQYTQISYYINN